MRRILLNLNPREVPTEPALSVPTPDPTPQQAMDPFQKPQEYSETRPDENYQGQDRSLLSVRLSCGESDASILMG